jgi:hypothetical protein
MSVDARDREAGWMKVRDDEVRRVDRMTERQQSERAGQ